MQVQRDRNPTALGWNIKYVLMYVRRWRPLKISRSQDPCSPHILSCESTSYIVSNGCIPNSLTYKQLPQQYNCAFIQITRSTICSYVTYVVAFFLDLGNCFVGNRDGFFTQIPCETLSNMYPRWEEINDECHRACANVP